MNGERILSAAFALALLAGCGQSECVSDCESARPQLIQDFGVSPTDINCSDSKWAKATTCEQCQNIFETDYGVKMTGCDASSGSLVPSH